MDHCNHSDINATKITAVSSGSGCSSLLKISVNHIGIMPKPRRERTVSARVL